MRDKKHPGMWFPFYGEKFIAATIGLSFLEGAAYAKMLPLYYEIGPFPVDKTRLYRIMGCESDEHRRAVDHVLDEFFVLREDGWYQEFAEGIKVQMAQRSFQAQERGRKSAEVRAQKYGSAQPVSRNALETLSRASGKAPELDTDTGTDKEKTRDKPPTPLEASAKQVPVKGRAVALPEWLKPEDWKAYLDHRTRLRKPMTEEAQRRAIAELGKLRTLGSDPARVIDQSIVQGWVGLFEVKHRPGSAAQKASQAERVAAMLFNDPQPDGEIIDG